MHLLAVIKFHVTKKVENIASDKAQICSFTKSTLIQLLDFWRPIYRKGISIFERGSKDCIRLCIQRAKIDVC